jgi:arylsulfatase
MRRRSGHAVFRDVRQSRHLHDGWYACTTPPDRRGHGNGQAADVNDYKWELYNLAEDFSQNNDLAARNPRSSRSCRPVPREAAKYQVLPLDNSILPRLITPRPSATAGKSVSLIPVRMPAFRSAMHRAS